MPDLATGAVAPTPAAGSAPALDQSAAGQVPARLDADLLLDAEDGVKADQRYDISAGKLKEVNAVRKAFREAGIDPALAPNVIQAALAWVQATRDAEAAGGQPAKPAPTAADDEDTKARAALHRLDPDIPKAVQIARHYVTSTADHAKAVATDAREILGEELGIRHLPADGEALTHMEEMLTASIQENEADWLRFMRGVGHERIIKRHLDKVLKTVAKLGGGDAAHAAAALETKKRASAGLPPRLPSGTGGGSAGGSAPNKPPASLKEADERVRARLAASA